MGSCKLAGRGEEGDGSWFFVCGGAKNNVWGIFYFPHQLRQGGTGRGVILPLVPRSRRGARVIALIT